MFTWCMN